MKRFNALLLIIVLFSMGCGTQVSSEPGEVHWDRDMCQRCKMLISDRSFAAQAINTQNGRKHLFDDIGCAILWFKENGHKWEDGATLWVKEANTGMWVDAKSAFFSTKAITPMGYGFGAQSEKKEGLITFEEMRLRMLRGEHMANRHINARLKK